jgi:hypothetical protein
LRRKTKTKEKMDAIAPQQKRVYTDRMHIIAGGWSDLAAGYQAVELVQARLESEFGRAVQAGQKQKFLRELSEWEKKRRALIVMAAIAPLSIITLCLAAFYFREVACVIVYWTILVAIILITLAVAGRNYLVEAMNRPAPGQGKTLAVDLKQLWWNSLSSNSNREPAVEEAEDKEITAFLNMLGQSLAEDCLAIREPGPLVVCPAGVWLFQLEAWKGTITKEEGVWKQTQSVRDKWGRKESQEQTHEPGPDEAWLRRKVEIEKTLSEGLPQRAWSGSPIQGGVAFTNSKAILDKAQIQGNTAAYGTARGWAERMRGAAAAEFTMESQLEILEAVLVRPGEQAESAKEEAERLYQEAADELRRSIAKMVN